jgi:hypothetical protein
MDGSKPLVADTDDTGNKSLVWGVYVSLSSDDDATHEARTQSLPVEVMVGDTTHDWQYTWNSSAEGVSVLTRSGFGFPGGHLLFQLCLEPRLMVGCGHGRHRMVKSGKILFMEWKVRSSDLEYGRSVDSHYDRRHYQNDTIYRQEVRHRRDTMINNTSKDGGGGEPPPLFQPRDNKDQFTLLFQLNGGRGRMFVKYDACKYFDASDGGMAGQFLATRIWLELDDPMVLANATQTECHRIVCKIDTITRPPPLASKEEKENTMSRRSSVYLGRPQSIATDGFGVVRTFKWTSDHFYTGRRSSFPGIPVMGEQDKDELEEMRSLGEMIRNQQQRNVNPVVSNSMDAIISARFLKQGRVYMPDNDEISNKRLVLPMDVDADAVITFKFFNLRHDPASHYFRSVELKIRWGEFVNVHQGRVGNEGGGGGGGGGEYHHSNNSSSNGESSIPTGRSSRRRKMSINGLKKQWRKFRSRANSIAIPSPLALEGSDGASGTRARSMSIGVEKDPAAVMGRGKAVPLQLQRCITEDMTVTIRFSVSTTTKNGSDAAAFEIISTTLAVNDYAEALQMRHAVSAKST